MDNTTMERQDLFKLAGAAQRVAENHLNRRNHLLNGSPVDLKMRFRLGGAGSLLDIRICDNNNEQSTLPVMPQDIIPQEEKRRVRILIPKTILKPTITKRTPGFYLNRRFVSADDIRTHTRRTTIMQELLKTTLDLPQRKINNFLQNHGYLANRIKSSLTSDEFYKIIQFVYGLIDPYIFNDKMTKTEIIQTILAISKRHSRVVSAVKRDYLLNPMAPHAKQHVLKFVAELCAFVTKQLEM